LFLHQIGLTKNPGKPGETEWELKLFSQGESASEASPAYGEIIQEKG
jgi:hypothetical protein